ncbi:1224_t:CDS:2, partial [Paraglomus occultum]
IEAELALWLVRDKALLEPVESNGLPLEKVAYHMELFEACQVRLEEIRKKIPQEPIPHEKVALITGTSSVGTFGNFSMLQTSIENPSELLSALEILLCFVKRMSTGDGDVLLNDYVKQWMKIETLEKHAEMKKILNAGLELKHIVSLYELVEDRVDDILIDCVDPKYKRDMPVDIHDELMNACEFEDTDGRLGKIPAAAFAKALKRFALRMLSVKRVDENWKLNLYLSQMDFWSDVSEEIVGNYFPENLLVAHSHSAYCAIKTKMDKIRSKQQSMASSNNCPLMKSHTSIKVKKAQRQKFNHA